jgi:enoyl-CoA hydratase/carnithine racemase
VARVQHEVVSVEREGATAVVTIDHPPANAISGQVVDGLSEALGDAEADPSCRAMVVTGAGPKFFSAGADISEFGGGSEGLGRALDLTLRFEQSRLPLVAAVNGIAFGGGCELSLACDIRICARTARFGQPEIKLGIIPGWGGTQRLPRAIGVSRATRMLLTGDPIDARTALDWGLVTEVVADADVRSRAEELAEELAGQAPLAVAAIKRAVREGLDKPLGHGLDVETHEFTRLFSSDDAREGITAYLEKRQPTWKGH